MSKMHVVFLCGFRVAFARDADEASADLHGGVGVGHKTLDALRSLSLSALGEDDHNMYWQAACLRSRWGGERGQGHRWGVGRREDVGQMATTIYSISILKIPTIKMEFFRLLVRGVNKGWHRPYFLFLESPGIGLLVCTKKRVFPYTGPTGVTGIQWHTHPLDMSNVC